MHYAIIFTSVVLLTASFFLRKRPRFGLMCLNSRSEVKERIIKLQKLHGSGFFSRHKIFKKINVEIKIFNKMHLIMPCRRGVPVLYSDYFAKLLSNPRFKIKTADGFERLIYLVAAANLIFSSNDIFVCKQLLKNCIYVFGRSNKYTTRNCTLLHMQVFAVAQPLFKLLSGESFSKFVQRDENTVFANSYIIKTEVGAIIKNYVDETLNAECYEIEGRYRFIYCCSDDKMKCNISHTADTFYCREKDKFFAFFVHGAKVNFETSIAEKTDVMKIYINIETGGKIFIVRGESKNEILNTIGIIKKRGGSLNYLLNLEKLQNNCKNEKLYAQAFLSRFITGENLKEHFRYAVKYVPTLNLFTLAYTVEKVGEFFDIIDCFGRFKEIFRISGNLNIVILYSSQNDVIREHIRVFTNRDNAQKLVESGIFLFFIDKVKIPNKAIYYFSKMSEMQNTNVKISIPSRLDSIAVETIISNSVPVTYTSVVSNTLNKPQNKTVSIPIELGRLCAVSRKNAFVYVVNLRNGYTKTFKLPMSAYITDEFDRIIDRGETVCQKIYVRINVKLAGYEEKVFKIIKNEKALSLKERKLVFMTACTDICVRSTNKELERIFKLPIVNEGDEVLFDAVKSALKNFNTAVFFSLFQRRVSVPENIYTLLMEKLIGLRLIRGSVQLVPNILITGSFEISFNYKEMPYSFNVKEKGSGFTVLHKGIEYKNFLQVI